MTASVSTPLLVDARTAAGRLAISVRMLQRLVERGELRAIHIGRSVRFELTELQRFVSQKATEVTA